MLTTTTTTIAGDIDGAGSDCDGFKTPVKLAIIDVKKARLNADVKRPICVRLPPGDQESGLCARLNVSMYGIRDAVQKWEREYTNMLRGLGYRRGAAHPCLFSNESSGGRLVVHGDDFTLLAEQGEIDRTEWCVGQREESSMRTIPGMWK